MRNFFDKSVYLMALVNPEYGTMRRFLLKLSVFLLVFYSFSALIYFFSDENRLTDRNAIIFVNDLSKNDLVIHQPISDDRRIVYQRILKNKNQHFKYLFIGSSRILQFGKHTGYSDALNLGVSGAVMEDVLIVDSLRRNYGITCDSLFVDFNPWYVQTKTDERYLQFNLFENLKHAFSHIFKFDHSLNSIKTIPISKSSNYQPVTNVNKPELYHVKKMDGSSVHKPLTSKKRSLEIEHFVAGLYQMKNFDSIQLSRLNQFKIWVKKNSEVTPTVIVLSPFHPLLFQQRISDHRVKNIILTEQMVRTWNLQNAQILGTFNGRESKFVDSDFYDGFHLTDVAVRTKLRLH